MNTAIASSSGGNEGVGFSIPINLVASIARQLIERNGVTKAFLGVQLDRNFDPAAAISVGLSRPRGARVKDITPNSPATGKLEAGDVILEYAGVRVDNDRHLINLVSLTESGREVPLVVYRDQKFLKIPVKLGVKADSPAVNRLAPGARPLGK